MSKLLFCLFSFLALTIFNAGCNSFQKDETADVWTFPAETGVKYYIDYVIENSEKTPAPSGDDQPYIMFSKSNDALRINGMAGDNLFFGGIVVSGNKIKINNVGVTRRAGPNGKFEQSFLNALNKIDQIKCEKKELNLYYGDTLLIYGNAK